MPEITVNISRLLTIFMLFSLAACDDSSKPAPATILEPTVLIGQFIDAPVVGIGYRTATQSGITDADGNFSYVEGEQVVFFIGDIEFPPVTATGVVTPLDIARQSDDTATLESDMVVNILRLLQSLDSDGDPGNGIDILASLAPTNAIDFSLSAAEFEAAFSNEFQDTDLVDTNTAKNHFQSELDKINNVTDSPTLSITGSISNDAGTTGTWTLTINGEDFGSTGSLSSTSFLSFNAALVAEGSSYEITTDNDNCIVNRSTGTLSADDVTNVEIVCTEPVVVSTFNINGSIINDAGLSGNWELLINSAFAADGGLISSTNVSFTTSVTAGSNFEVRTSNSACTVSNGTGAITANVSDVTIVCVATPSGPNGTTSAAQINTDLVGDYTMIYRLNAAGGPFTDGEEVAVTVGADASLTIASTSYSDAFNRDIGAGSPHLPEIIWLDSTTNIEFALSDNQSGSFNEINVGDASNPGTTGIPGFLGQLRIKEAEMAKGAIVGVYAGSYSFTVTQSGNGYSAGDTFDFTIAEDGSLTYVKDKSGSNVVLLVTEATYDTSDSRANTTIKPGLQVSHRSPDETAGTFEYVTLFFEAETVVAITLDGFKLTAEARPLPQDLVDFMSALIAASPVTLRITKDSSTYGGQFISNGSLCQAITVEISDPADSTNSISELQVGTRLYARTEWRFNLNDTSGVRSLGLNGFQIDLHPGGEISLGEGAVDFGTLLLTNPQDFATNIQSDVDTACSDYTELSVQVSVPAGSTLASTNGGIELLDASDDSLLTRYPANSGSLFLQPGDSDTRSVYLIDTTAYQVRYTQFSGLYSTIFCPVSNGSGTASASNTTVTVVCDDQPPAGTFTLSGVMDRNITGTLTLGDGNSSKFFADVNGATDTYLLQGLPDGTEFSIDAKLGFSACLSAPITGVISGADQVLDIICDL